MFKFFCLIISELKLFNYPFLHGKKKCIYFAFVKFNFNHSTWKVF